MCFQACCVFELIDNVAQVEELSSAFLCFVIGGVMREGFELVERQSTEPIYRFIQTLKIRLAKNPKVCSTFGEHGFRVARFSESFRRGGEIGGLLSIVSYVFENIVDNARNWSVFHSCVRVVGKRAPVALQVQLVC